MAPDKGAEGGAGASTESESTGSQTDDASGGTTQSSGEQGSQDKDKDAQPQFTQAQLDAIVKDRLTRERAKAEADRKKAEDAAQAEALKAKEEWKTLAQQHEAKLAELQPQAESLTATIAGYEARLVKDLDAEIKEWPEEVRAMDPGADVPLLERLAWRDKARALAHKLLDAAATPGNTRRPPAAGAAGDEKAREKAVADYRRQWRAGIKP
jgi:hypothetical protein